jgi:hypothetical protein
MYSHKHNDILIEGTDNLLKHATDYYKNLFGPGEGNKMSLDPNIWSIDERLSVEDNCILDEPFSESEVKNAYRYYGSQ